MGSLNILPDSRLDTAKNVQRVVTHGVSTNWVPVFCANCGAGGGYVPEESCTFAFYLCDDCVDKWGCVAGTYCEPDAVFWQRVRAEQQEKYGRQLSTLELTEVLKDDHNSITKLVREGQA